MPRFTHLHTHSHYSLLDGLAKIDDLIARTKELGMDSVALTDHGNLYGAIEFYKKAKAAGIKPILGVEAYVAPGHRSDKKPKDDELYYHLILLAENNTGWKNLLKLVTRANLEGFYYKPRMDKEILKEHSEGLIALSACLSGEVSKTLKKVSYGEARRVALEYQEIFGKNNFFLEIGHHPGIKETIKVNEGLKKLSQELGIPLVATQDIHYLKTEDAETHDILLAVQTGDTIYKTDRLTLSADNFSMRSPDEMATLFGDTTEAIDATTKIAGRCNVNIRLNEIQLPKFPVPEDANANDYMRKLIYERIGKRFAEVTDVIKERIEYELSVILRMNFADYFLIVSDFINWAKERGIVVGPGRGSAAGSMVAYILGITDVDPIKYDLLFERFLNPDRIQMPDIDVDITDRRRDEVFGYLQEKYGMDQVAHIITFGTMAARAAIRDVGRALGISYGFCDQLAKLIPFNQDLATAMENVAELKTFYDTNPDAKKIIDAAKKLEGVARHASVHACGTVIGKASLTQYLPLQRAPQDEHVIVTQFEMHSVEDLGLLKMDLLGLKNLTIIEDALRLINERRPAETQVDISNIPIDDAKTFTLLQAAETTGIFQLESAGMRRYLKELKPTSIEDIVAMVALYRPGPMEFIPKYINCKHGREKIEYLHPKLEPILGKTYGVGVYQEQMMRIARDLAGFSLAEADTLRKAIGKKIKKLLDEQQTRLVSGMIKNGIDERTANAIWELFPAFARYGFNRCLSKDTKIQDPLTGELNTIENLYLEYNRDKSPRVISLEKNFKLKNRQAAEVICNGKKPVWELTTKSGRKIKATKNHPFLISSGWKKLGEIGIGEKIATPRFMPEPINPIKIERHKLGTLGYLLSEGNFCHPHGFYFYSTSQIEINDYVSFLEKFNNTQATINNSKSAASVYAKRTDINRVSEAVQWMESLGLKYKSATQKFLPEFVYRLKNDDLALLIAKMFQGDGCVNIKRDPQIFYATSSKEMAWGLQHLLLRFGILSSIHTKNFKYRGGIKIGYTITISRYDNIEKFADKIGIHLIGQKYEFCKRIVQQHPIINGILPPWAGRGSRDIIPVNLVSAEIRNSIRTSGLTLAQFSASAHIAERLLYSDASKKGYLRETVGALARALENETLFKHASSDIYWDEVASIEYAGEETTYDLTVDETHNFVANDIIAHNSHAVCYAMVGYQTAYLRAHYPIEFYTALLNADSGDIDRLAFLMAEAKKAGIPVLPPDINKSFASFTPDEKNIRFGLAAVKNVGEAIVGAVMEERNARGPFKGLADILSRVQHKDLNKKSLESLVKCGALDSFGIERNTILGNIDDILKFGAAIRKQSASNQTGLFATNYANMTLKIKAHPAADTKTKLAWEKELLGLYVSDHPLTMHRDHLKNVNARTIHAAFAEKSEINRFVLAGIVTRAQKIITKKGTPMLFAKIEDTADSIEVVVFPDVYSKTMDIWKENSAVLLTGKMSWRDSEGKFMCDNGREL